MVASVSACTTPDTSLQVDHALYYLTGEGGAGVWHGEGARYLGFTGTLKADHLMAAFSGLGPDGYTRHVQLPKGRNRQPAWDVTFSAPKSVSVLWSVLGAEDRHRIESLVMQAAKRAVDYLDSKALLTRRGRGGKDVEHAKGVYVLCPHGTSRSQDPQLHVHTLAINMCVRDDGTTGTIRSKDLYLHKMAAGALFRLELATLLSKALGLRVEQDDWSFKIKGVPQSLCDEQSKRRQIIEQVAKEKGWHSPRTMAELAIKTRSAKGIVSMPECTKAWLETGEKHSFGRNEAEQLLDAAQDDSSAKLMERLREESRDKLLRKAIDDSIESLSLSQSYFSEKELVQLVAASLQASGISVDEIIDAVEDAAGGLEHRVDLQGSHYRYYTTNKTLAAERELIEIADRMRSQHAHNVSDKAVAKAKTTVEKGLSDEVGVPAELTFDQQAALSHVTLEPGRIKLVQGYAGTGKTLMLQAANIAWLNSGYRVLGTSMTGKAAVGLENATSIPSVTLVKLLWRLRPELVPEEFRPSLRKRFTSAVKGAYFEGFRAGAWMRNPLGRALKEMEQAYEASKTDPPSLDLDQKTILVVDEAGLIPTRLMLALLQECDKFGVKLVLVGDALQLPPIEAGGPFASLTERVGCQYLTSIVRQRHDWMKEASYSLIQNEPRHALDLYAANDSLRIEKSHQSAIARLIADYGKLSSSDYESSIALTSTRKEAAQINAGIQHRRLAAGQLGADSTLLKNGERVFVNDRVMFTSNSSKLGLRNGMIGTVVNVLQPPWRDGNARIEVRLEKGTGQANFNAKGGIVTIDLAKYHYVQLGYAATTHKAQGVTVKTSYVLFGESMLNKQMAVTQLTRAADATTIYAAEAQLGGTLESLANRMGRSASKDLASDHRLVVQPGLAVEARKELLQEAISRLAPEKQGSNVQTPAYLSDARLTANQTGALWQLIGQYTKLANEDYRSTIAVAADPKEVQRINNGVQNHRRSARQLGVDSTEIRQGERVHRGDRVLIEMPNEQGVSRTLIGTAIGMGYAEGGIMPAGCGSTPSARSKPWMAIQLDSQFENGESAKTNGRITVDARDFDKLQLGYAATIEKLKDVSVQSSLVLLPEGKCSSREIEIQLTRGTKDVSLYGTQSQYGPVLDAGNARGSFISSLNSAAREDSSTLADQYKQKLEEQQRMQKANNEQSQLSQQQSFHI